jgi:DNA-directed RNA polymerase
LIFKKKGTITRKKKRAYECLNILSGFFQLLPVARDNCLALVLPFCFSNISLLNYDISSFLFLLINVAGLYDDLDRPQLLEDFQTSYPTLQFPPLPERGNFDLQKVLRSPYFFN